MIAPPTPPLFREEQRFSQPWLWLFIAGMDLVCAFAFLGPVAASGQMPPLRGGDITAMVFTFFLCLAITLLFLLLKLTTEVRPEGLSVRFTPLMAKPVIIPFHTVKSYHIRTYRPILEYGGWGIKRGIGGQAYNVSGNKGLQLELNDGKKILIGTRQPERLKLAVDGAANR
jgi:hypothetical protein